MPSDRPRRSNASRGDSAPRGTGSRQGGARSGGPRSSGGSRTSFTKYGERGAAPRTGGPRREGDAPRGRGPRREGDAPRGRGPRRDGDAPRGRGPRRDGDAPRPPRERSERRPTGERSERKPYGERAERKPYGERSGRASGPRTGGPRREGDAPRGRGPRREDGAARPPRERSERKPYGERSERKPYGERAERKPYGERSGRPSGPRTGGPRREGDAPRGRGPRREGDAPRGRGPRRDSDTTRGRIEREERVEKPLTAAEKKAREVRARTGGRRTEGHGEPKTPPKRERVEWVDEGVVRGTARRAAQRASGDAGPARIKGIPRSDRPLPGAVAKEVERGVGARQSKSAAERLQKAIDAFERERYAEAAKLLVALTRQLPRMALVHELAGLCAYRQEKWRTVVNELEATRVLDPSRTSVLPVLADAYRALRRWAKVNDLWEELKGLSPHPEILAEGRIVTAGALADQGKIAEAIALFGSVLAIPKRVQEYHLRQWYVVADLNDRVGNVVDARRMFDRIAKFDRSFADVDERIALLGSPR